MVRNITCPQNCQDKHNEHRITMTEIKSDLKYIREKLDENSTKIIEVFENKADKEEVVWLKNVVYGTAITLLGILGSGLIWLFVYYIENR